MNTAIPPNPKAIIAALLDIASAAYALHHNADTPGLLIYDVSGDDMSTLAERLWHLDRLPQVDSVDGHLTGPARARHYLQSFLEGGDVIDLIEKRTRTFPPMTLRIDMTPEQEAEMKRVLDLYASKPLEAGEFIEGVNAQTIPVSALTGAADVQRDGIQFEFEPQEWKAPATGPGFTPSAEFPTSGPIHHDFYTHRDAWRALIGRALIARSEKAEGDDGSYAEHELRAFDRAFDSLPPQHERRLRERMIEPAIPVVGKEALVDATRPLFVKAMQSQGHRADLDERGLYKGVSEHRWEGWRAAVESMGFKASPSYNLNIDYTAKIGDAGERYHGQFKFAHPLPVQWRWSELWQVMNEAAAEGEDIGCLREAKTAMGAVSAALDTHAPGWRNLSTRGMDSAVLAIEQLATTAKNEIRTNMLADTADEALRIINDAGLLKNLVELFTMRDPGTAVTIREQIPYLYEDAKWKLDIMPRGDRAARTYESTSLHQVIVVAHKGEQDHEYPEHEECKFCGFTVETPCDAPPPAECPTAVAAQVSEAMLPVTKTVGGRPLTPKPPGPFALCAIESAQIAKDAMDKPFTGRKRMVELVCAVKDIFGVVEAKMLFTPPGTFIKLADVPEDRVEDIIKAAEEKLKKVIE